jgi:hypothetical protein
MENLFPRFVIASRYLVGVLPAEDHLHGISSKPSRSLGLIEPSDNPVNQCCKPAQYMKECCDEIGFEHHFFCSASSV